MTKTHETRRSRLQFSLRSLVILTLLVAAYFAGRTPAVHRAVEAEREAIQQAQIARVAEMRAKESEMQAKFQLQMAKANIIRLEATVDTMALRLREAAAAGQIIGEPDDSGGEGSDDRALDVRR